MEIIKAIWSLLNKERLIRDRLKKEIIILKDKSVWDWMSLLIVPSVIFMGGYYLSEKQMDEQINRESNILDAQVKREKSFQETQIKIEDERNYINILNNYRRSITDLMINGGLSSDKPKDGVELAANALTASTAHQLDAKRKGQFIVFLYKAELINKDSRRVSLNEVNLSGANLSEANLSGADLSGADLSEAELFDANLSGADLSEAELFYADLSGADLSEAELFYANLSGANLSGADLSEAELFGVDFSDAEINTTDFSDADFSGVDFIDADFGDDFRSTLLKKGIFTKAQLDFTIIEEPEKTNSTR